MPANRPPTRVLVMASAVRRPARSSISLAFFPDFEQAGLPLRFQATIRALIPTGDVRSQTFEARIDLPEAARGSWAVGQLVSVAIPIKAGESTLTVPRDALVLRQRGQYVYRINGENIAVRINVDVGDSQGELIAVTGALREGDSVAIRGAESLSDGAAVRILSQETAALDNNRDTG